MKKKKTLVILSVVLALIIAAGIGAYAASNYGTSDDPLITLSYLDNKLTPDLMKQFDLKLDSTVAELEALIGSGSSADTYKLVTLNKGQVIKGSVGCEILLRIGSAKVSAASTPGLVDLTSGGTLNNGSALTSNHLYLVTIEGHGISATESSTKVLVRGSYVMS
ncbi:MAG TPA: hypothetical protein GXZ52_04645 [Clostridiales bacterium]|jgi:hypothetical protein|nr:hypothetical protein [Clostridiales bacterium]